MKKLSTVFAILMCSLAQANYDKTVVYVGQNVVGARCSIAMAADLSSWKIVDGNTEFDSTANISSAPAAWMSRDQMLRNKQTGNFASVVPGSGVMTYWNVQMHCDLNSSGVPTAFTLQGKETSLWGGGFAGATMVNCRGLRIQ